jgi:LSD1 subclass zinc finger protein
MGIEEYSAKIDEFIDVALKTIGEKHKVELVGNNEDYYTPGTIGFRVMLDGKDAQLIKFKNCDKILEVTFPDASKLSTLLNGSLTKITEDYLTKELGVCLSCDKFLMLNTSSNEFDVECACCDTKNHFEDYNVCDDCFTTEEVETTVKVKSICKVVKKTPYDYCLDLNFRLNNLSEWVGGEDDYFVNKISKDEFLTRIKDCNIILDSTPRKSEKYLNFRMYGFVPYNLSGIQKGIQFGHAVVRYQLKAEADKIYSMNNSRYKRWAKNHETFIILNGGSTNNNASDEFYGSLQQHRDAFVANDIFISEFIEPDLNRTLSAFCFLVDERVYDKVLYPNYVSVPKPWKDKRHYKPTVAEMAKWDASNKLNYDKWVIKIGGPKNAFLREYLNGKSLA